MEMNPFKTLIQFYEGFTRKFLIKKAPSKFTLKITLAKANT